MHVSLAQMTYKKRISSHAVINAKLRLPRFPKKWESAEVIMPPNDGKGGTFPQNYRLTGVSPGMNKCAGRIMANIRS